AALIEGGAFVRYFVTPRLTLRAGYEFWWLYGLGLPTHQFGSRLNLNSGRNFQGTQDLFLYGASGGFEYVF
ncbi:MAG TPA: hypothetical protein VL175_01395, partial [Pirellulales bacterium]|nr:hypothetical protein [Pirellulales bacterium]